MLLAKFWKIICTRKISVLQYLATQLRVWNRTLVSVSSLKQQLCVTCAPQEIHCVSLKPPN